MNRYANIAMKIAFDAMIQPTPADLKEIEKSYVWSLETFIEKLNEQGGLYVIAEVQKRWSGSHRKQTLWSPAEAPEVDIENVELEVEGLKRIQPIHVDALNKYAYDNWSGDEEESESEQISLKLESHEAKRALEKACRETKGVISDVGCVLSGNARNFHNVFAEVDLAVSFILAGNEVKVVVTIPDASETVINHKLDEKKYDLFEEPEKPFRDPSDDW